MKSLDFDLYFITDSKLSRNGVLQDVKDAVEAGVRVVQYRENEKSTGEMICEGKKIREICSGKDVLFLVNNRVDVALACGADGVHLGQQDMPIEEAKKLMGDAVIGITVHNLEEAIEAEKKAASYLGLSPVFETKTKPDAGKAAGVELIKIVKEKVGLPAVAIGGINKENLAEVLSAGADSVAVISALFEGKELKENIKWFRDKINNKRLGK